MFVSSSKKYFILCAPCLSVLVGCLAGCAIFQTHSAVLSPDADNRSIAQDPSAAIAVSGFVGNVSDFSPQQYAATWSALTRIYGASLPSPIAIIKHEFPDGSSQFRANSNPQAVWIHPRTYASGVALKVIAHEAAHLAHWRLTSRQNEPYAASYDNEIRFVDEGIANLVGERVAGDEASYRRRVAVQGYLARSEKALSFALMGNWWNAKSDPQQPGQFNPLQPSYSAHRFSYEVGSAFVLFLEKEGGNSGVLDLLRAYGRTRDLGAALAQTYPERFGRDPAGAKANAEAQWLSFVDTFATEPRVPRLSAFNPANGANTNHS